LLIADWKAGLAILNPQSEIINPERSPSGRGYPKVFLDENLLIQHFA
jgi:hypothetical protein